MFGTKHQLLFLLTMPPIMDYGPWIKITLRDLRRGLREYFRKEITTRHIKRLLHDLEHEGVIERKIDAWRLGSFGNQAQATRFKVIDFDRAFKDPPY